VIAELTRWVAQNLELTLKSEINVGSRLSEKQRQTEAEDHKMQDNKGRTKRLREGRSESIGDREEKRKRDFRACKQQATTAEKPLRASL
jgi:hypothetical protein